MKIIDRVFSKKNFGYFSYFLLTFLMILLLWSVGKLLDADRFFELIELKTLDFRFSISHKALKPNPNVVIVNIDDTSLEILENEFGRWPWNREVYTKLTNYLESGGADSVVYDLMFLGYQKGFEDKDIELAKTITKYKNVYVSMNFDSREIKNPPVLPENIKVKLENHSKNMDFSDYTFTNARLIMDNILNSTSNIGIINLSRDQDGITRHCPLFIKYQDDFYPYLAFKVASDYLKKRENLVIDKYVINRDNQLILGDRKIQLNNEGKMIINWYGPDRTFVNVPLWQVINSINAVKNGKQPSIPANFFKDKVVFVGVSSTSLFDVKSTPLSSIYPGVEVQATIFNNIIDGNPIKRADTITNLLIGILLSILVGIMVIKLKSSLYCSFLTIFLGLVYIAVAAVLMKDYFIWIGIINQIIMITLTFTIMFIIKYLIKSKDFEYTYKLATTDGLTNLHNHRYFQEHMLHSIERAKRHKSNFSLLLIDIDFFKKFNDTYGHQAGDAVLRQVADTLKKIVRATDLVARYGGEEMAIILDNADIDEAYFIANKVCSTVASKTFKLSETIERNVTISLGVATYPQHGLTPTELIEFADQGLYKAKENGRNQVGKIDGYEPKIPPEGGPDPQKA